MENATRALLMAAGVLIGVLILSLGVYLFYTFGGFATNTQKEIDENTVAQFNNEFLKYNGLNNLTIQDAITIKNYALEKNNEDTFYDYTKDRAETNNAYIDVYYQNSSKKRNLIFGKNDKDLLKEEFEKKFTCKVNVNKTTGLVNEIYFYYQTAD